LEGTALAVVNSVLTSAKPAGCRSQVFVYLAVAIVVYFVADFWGGAVKGVALVGNAPLAGGDGVEALPFTTGQHDHLFVYFTVTIVVTAVTDFWSAAL
jgi:hypothetical protein